MKNRGAEPEFPQGMLTAPVHLDDVARQEWERVARLLTDAGVVTEADARVLETYCVHYSRFVKAQREIAEGGEVLTADGGQQYGSPWLRISNNAHDRMLRAATELGITPCSRSRVRADKPVTSSKSSYFEARRGG